MENFITGFPGREYQIRKALADVLGKEKAQFFFDKVHSSFLPSFDKTNVTKCIVPRILLHRRRCKILQVPGTELHPCPLQLPPL